MPPEQAFCPEIELKMFHCYQNRKGYFSRLSYKEEYKAEVPSNLLPQAVKCLEMLLKVLRILKSLFKILRHTWVYRGRYVLEVPFLTLWRVKASSPFCMNLSHVLSQKFGELMFIFPEFLYQHD